MQLKPVIATRDANFDERLTELFAWGRLVIWLGRLA